MAPTTHVRLPTLYTTLTRLVLSKLVKERYAISQKSMGNSGTMYPESLAEDRMGLPASYEHTGHSHKHAQADLRYADRAPVLGCAISTPTLPSPLVPP